MEADNDKDGDSNDDKNNDYDDDGNTQKTCLQDINL